MPNDTVINLQHEIALSQTEGPAWANLGVEKIIILLENRRGYCQVYPIFGKRSAGRKMEQRHAGRMGKCEWHRIMRMLE